ncbi:hypothetical protein LHJ74_11545 [Streptomyces sp. N2-109]|uniref:Uncharacterized protein n=1 Tax=Streptomyces gossypii TaxID=2883101 RepID=A0ABT2JRL1_9ACTN|nr:hypothetical protein [Streptomyces gossypii]MCT2590535.1 hypothetical protein [Streptomyces gossypii]
MGWKTVEFGSSHEGITGAVLADGTEPKPVYLDAGSSAYMLQTSEWWAYNGKLGRPEATQLRASCSCGWRGAPQYPIDWSQLGNYPYDVDTSGPRGDWSEHIANVEHHTVPLPDEMEELLDRLETRLDALVVDSPLAALKAAAVLERTIAHIGREAAYGAQADDMSWETIAKGLGLIEKDARSRLNRYGLGR